MRITAFRCAPLVSRSTPRILGSALLAGALLPGCAPDLESLVAEAVNRELEGRLLPGPQGEPGPAGRSCWDLNGNNQAEPSEDINGDGAFDALDCAGPEGSTGPAGPPGRTGAPGTPGLACWDLNGDGVGQLETEDLNEDGELNALDCRGPQGSAGGSGPPGTPGEIPSGSFIITTEIESPTGFTFTGTSFSQGGAWTVLPAMPVGLYSPAAAAANNRVYVFGGLLFGVDNGFVDTVYELDLTTGAWTSKTPMPTARAEAVAVVLGGQVYVLGGTRGDAGPTDVVERYDPQSDTWSVAAPMSQPRDYPAATLFEDGIMVLGGWDGLTQSRTVEVYDPQAEAWSPRASMTIGRYAPGAAVLNDRVHAIGGYNGREDERAIEIYDPVADAWTLGASLHQPREGFGTLVIRNRIFAVGGISETGGILRVLDTAEEYDPIGDLWHLSTPLRAPRGWMGFAATADALFVLGGQDRFPPRSYLDSCEQFTPPTVFYVHRKD